MSETAERPATASALASLEVRVARLESDVAHIQRDVSSIKDDLKTLTRGFSELRADVATLLERSTHLATREWVMWCMLSAFLILIAVLVAVVGYAPRIQAFLGAAPASGSVAAPR